MRSTHKIAFALALFSPLLGCTPVARRGTTSGTPGVAGSTGGDLYAGDTTDDGGDVDPGGSVDPGLIDCGELAKLIYIVDESDMFSSFEPSTLKITDIGKLSCPSQPGATPFSMAVDRTPSAWVLYSSGEIFNVDVTTANCSKTAYKSGQLGFQVFGMGFVSNTSGSTDETLYIGGGDDTAAGLGSSTLGSIDTSTLKVSSIGSITGWPELTGTGDANLWGFFPDDTKPRVAQIDRQSAALSHVFNLPSLAGNPTDWAFAFWGGDFWIFLARDTDPSTVVYHLVQSTGGISPAISNTHRHIVGAGVSTCAPTVPIG